MAPNGEQLQTFWKAGSEYKKILINQRNGNKNKLQNTTLGNRNNIYKYKMKNNWLNSTIAEKDLGVIMDQN